MNKEKLYKHIETMNKQQLIDLCKATTNIIDDLQQRIDKAIEYIETLKTYPFLEKYYIKDLLDMLRGEDNEKE